MDTILAKRTKICSLRLYHQSLKTKVLLMRNDILIKYLLCIFIPSFSSSSSSLICSSLPSSSCASVLCFNCRYYVCVTPQPHEVPEEYKRKAPGPAIKKEEKEPGVKSDEKPDTKPVVKGKSGLGQSKIKLDDSIKNDLKLKAEVKVNVKKGSCHKKEAVAQMIAESNADQAEKNRRKVGMASFLVR